MEEDIITDYKFKDVNIVIQLNQKESVKHIESDFEVIKNTDFNKLMIEKFMPWFKGETYKDRDNLKIIEGLKLYEITYHYSKIVAEYSPTGEDGFFGQFEFCFESGNEYTEDMLDAVAMKVYTHDNEIVKVSGYDI